jgi:hypothetical protein
MQSISSIDIVVEEKDITICVVKCLKSLKYASISSVRFKEKIGFHMNFGQIILYTCFFIGKRYDRNDGNWFEM